VLPPDGVPRTVTLTRRTVSTQPRLTARVLPDSVLLVRFDGFRRPIAQQLHDTLLAHAGARALILDFRGNGGGDAGETLRATGLFLPRRVVTGEFFTRVPHSRLGVLRSTAPTPLSAGGHAVWSKPTVVLTSIYSGSGAEMMTVILQERGKAAVVGDTTCGCLTAITARTEVLGGGILEMSDKGYRTAKGTVVEGRGVVPDVYVRASRADVTQQHDPGIDAARAWLRDHAPGGSR
jgi:carboxyl-terminal processing protease